MLISEPFAIQNILLACDALAAPNRPVYVDSVARWLVKEWGYEYPRDLIEQTIADRGLYLWNVQTHGYEKGRA